MARNQWPEITKTVVTDGHEETENLGGEKVGYARYPVHQAEQQGRYQQVKQGWSRKILRRPVERAPEQKFFHQSRTEGKVSDGGLRLLPCDDNLWLRPVAPRVSRLALSRAVIPIPVR